MIKLKVACNKIWLIIIHTFNLGNITFVDLSQHNYSSLYNVWADAIFSSHGGAIIKQKYLCTR